MTAGAAPSPSSRSHPLTPWLLAATLAWGGFALWALAGPFTAWPYLWRYPSFALSSGLVAAVFISAARRADLPPRLRLSLRYCAAAFAVTSFSYLYPTLALLGWLPELPVLVDAALTLSTYLIAVVGLLYWPRETLARNRWWHFGLDATIGAFGMGLFFLVLTTLPATGTASANERLTVLTYGAAQLLDLVALNIVMIRGLAIPSRRAFWTYMAALVLEIISLVLIQYFTALLHGDAINRFDDAFYILVQLIYVWSGLFFLFDPQREGEAAPVTRWMVTFNPLPLLAIAGVGALLVRESIAGNPLLVSTLALGLVLLVVLLAVRLMATVWDNARLVQQEAAMQAEKLEALRRIAGGISHEFNNMLTTVIGHAELGLSEVDPGSRVEQDLEGIRLAADRAARLTRDLLAYSGGQFVGRVPFDFAAELRRLLPRVEEALGPRVSLAHEIAGDPLWVNGDADQLGALVLTLARHAERRLPDGGRVLLRLTAVVVDTSRTTAADPLVPGRYLQLQLSDTGPSLPPEMLSRIFEPYFPAESHSRVPELGLAAVHGIATAHRAGLTVESGDPQGLTITLLLPAVRR